MPGYKEWLEKRGEEVKPYKTRIVLLIAFVACPIGLGFDISTVYEYWWEQERSLAIVATVSLALGGVISVPYMIYLCYLYRRNKEHTDYPVTVMRYLKLTCQSIPQATIAMYSMSICDISPSPKDYASLALSILSAVLNSVLVDQYYHHEKQLDFFDWSKKNRPQWINFVSSVVLNQVGLFTRMLVLVYFTFHLGWWTVLFLMLHWSVFTLIVVCHKVKEEEKGEGRKDGPEEEEKEQEEEEKKEDFEPGEGPEEGGQNEDERGRGANVSREAGERTEVKKIGRTGVGKCLYISSYSIFEAFFYTFLWSETKTPLADFLGTLLYVAENALMVVLAYFARQEEFCFLGWHTTVTQDLGIHIGFNAGILLLGIGFFFHRRRQGNIVNQPPSGSEPPPSGAEVSQDVALLGNEPAITVDNTTDGSNLV